jgi:hypothetical protein
MIAYAAWLVRTLIVSLAAWNEREWLRVDSFSPVSEEKLASRGAKLAFRHGVRKTALAAAR